MYTIHADKNPVAVGTALVHSALEHEQGNDVLLLLSGGSALSLLEGIKAHYIGPHVTVGVLDERYSHNPNERNIDAIMRHRKFWHILTTHGAHVIDTRPQGDETLHDIAQRYDRALKTWHDTHAKGVVIATMGIGADGHTAGILPHPENQMLFAKLFDDEKKYVVGYKTEKKKNPHTQRVTVTLPYLRTHVNHAVVFIGDAKKESILQRVLAKEGTLAHTPARVLREMKNVHIVVPNKINTMRPS